MWKTFNKNRALPLALALLGLAGCETLSYKAEAPSLRYDGIYQSNTYHHRKMTYWHYLRFYSNGDVIHVSSTGSPANLRKWFSRSNPDLTRGKVKLDGSRISFPIRSKGGAVNYSGKLKGSRLHLDYSTDMLGSRSSEVYHFVRVRMSP